MSKLLKIFLILIVDHSYEKWNNIPHYTQTVNLSFAKMLIFRLSSRFGNTGELIRRTEIKARGIYPEDKVTIHFTIFVYVNACVYLFCNEMYKLTWGNRTVTVKWQKCKKIEGNSILMRLKSEKNSDNHFSNCSLKILNLHKKSKYH